MLWHVKSNMTEIGLTMSETMRSSQVGIEYLLEYRVIAEHIRLLPTPKPISDQMLVISLELAQYLSLGYKIATKVRDFWSYLKIATKVRDFCSKLCLRVQEFLARFLPPCPLKSYPGWGLTIFFRNKHKIRA